MTRQRSLLLAALFATAPLVGRAQPLPPVVFDGLSDDARESVQNVTVNDSPEARKDIETAHGMERQKEWLKAAGWYQQVLEKYRTRVVAWKANDQNVIDRYRGIVYEVQQSLAKWPPEGIKAYRTRYESTAAGLLAGAGTDDLNALNAILETYFITESGKTAGLKLIDLHMEAGEFDAAGRIGELLLNFYPADQLVVERPRLLFRTAIAHHFCGDDKPAAARADELKQKFADATGSVFGKDAVLSQTLDELLKKQLIVAQNNGPDAWKMFSGSPDRSHVSNAVGHTGARIASIQLERRQLLPGSGRTVPGAAFNRAPDANADAASQVQMDEDRGMLLGVMPVVDAGELFFQDGARIWARSLDSGFPLTGWAQTYPGDERTQGIYQLRTPGILVGLGIQRGGQYTLTLTDNAVLGVMGQPTRSPQAQLDQQAIANPNADAGTRLVCLDRKTGVERWKTAASTLIGDDLLRNVMKDDERERLRALDFSGSPLVVGDNVFVLGRGGKDVQFENCYVLCFDLSSGKLRWSCLVASANALGNMAMVNGGDATGLTSTLSHLAYAGGRLYVNTNLGALAAIDAYNGSVVWLTLYRHDANVAGENLPVHWARRNFFNAQTVLRPWEYNPVFAQDGKLFVLPVDSRYLLVYDASTGQELKAIDLTDFQPDDDANLGVDRPRAMIAVHNGLVVLTGSRFVYTVKWAAYDEKKSFRDNVPANAVYCASLPTNGGRATNQGNDCIRGRAFATEDSVIVTTDKALLKLKPHMSLAAVGRYPEGSQEWDETEGPGNVIATGEHVIIAGLRNVNVYTDMTLARAKHDKEVAAAPNEVGPRLEYAKVMFAAGQPAVALEKMTEAVDLIGGIGQMRPGPDRQQIFSDAWTFAQRLAQDKRGESNDAAVKFYDLASVAADLPKEQVEYRLMRARFCRENRDAHSLELAVQLYQEILTHPEWRSVAIPSAEDSTTPPGTAGSSPAGAVARREMVDLKLKHPEAYSIQEKKAVAAMEEAKAAGDQAKLLAVANDYPNADAAPKAMLAAAGISEKSGDLRQATHILRQLNRDYGDTSLRPAIVEATARNYAGMPGGLGVAIARFRRAAGLADTRLTQPLKLPGGQTLADVTFKEAMAALAHAQPANDPAAALADLRVPDRQKAPANAKVDAFLALTDPRSVTVKGVVSLLQSENASTMQSRHDRVAVTLQENKVALFKPGGAEPLGVCEDFTDVPQQLRWMRAVDAPHAVVWSRNEIVALDGDSAKSLWKVSSRSLPEFEPSVLAALSGMELLNDTPSTNRNSGEEVVFVNNGNMRMARAGFRVNGFRQVRPAPAPVEEPQQPAAVGPEQIRHVVTLIDRVIAATSNGRVICLDGSNGKVVWQTKVGVHAVERLLATEDFTVARITEDGGVRLVVLDNFNGHVQSPVRNFVTSTGMTPQNMALSPEGMLVWTTPERLYGKDLYEGGKNLTFEFPARATAAVPPDLNANGIHRGFNAGPSNPALLFAGCTKENQLLIRGDRIIAVEEGGTQVVVHSIDTGKPAHHQDRDGHDVETRLGVAARGNTPQALNTAEVNISLSTAGPYVYVLSPRSLIAYNLDHPAVDQWFDQPLLSSNPNYRLAVPTKTELLVVAEPSRRRIADNDLGAAVKQLRLYDRRQLKDERDANAIVESGNIDYIQPLSDLTGIKGWQVVDGGVYYLTGDQTLHFLAGARS